MNRVAINVTYFTLKTSQEPKKGEIFRHYKGKLYEVIAPIAHHSEDLSKVIVYKALYNSPEFGKNSVWVRPLAMFQEHVIIDGKKVLRFEKVDPSIDPIDPVDISLLMMLSDD